MIWLPLAQGAFAQPSNGEVLARLLAERVDSLRGVKLVSSFHPQDWWPALQLDTTSVRQLSVGKPEIVYLPAGKEEVSRIVRLPVLQLNASPANDTLVYRDSVPKDLMRRWQQQDPEHLQGEYDHWSRRWLYPGLGLIAGAGTTVALFYLRSRQ